MSMLDPAGRDAPRRGRSANLAWGQIWRVRIPAFEFSSQNLFATKLGWAFDVDLASKAGGPGKFLPCEICADWNRTLPRAVAKRSPRRTRATTRRRVHEIRHHTAYLPHGDSMRLNLWLVPFEVRDRRAGGTQPRCCGRVTYDLLQMRGPGERGFQPQRGHCGDILGLGGEEIKAPADRRLVRTAWLTRSRAHAGSARPPARPPV